MTIINEYAEFCILKLNCACTEGKTSFPSSHTQGQYSKKNLAPAPSCIPIGKNDRFDMYACSDPLPKTTALWKPWEQIC